MDDPSKTGSEPWADEEVEQTGAYLGSGFGHTSLDLTSPFPDPGEHRRLVAFRRLTLALGNELELAHRIQRAIREIRHILEAEHATVFLYVAETNTLRTRVHDGEKVHVLEIAMGKGVVGQAAETGTPLNIPDISAYPDHDTQFEELLGFESRSVLAVPMTSDEGELVGVVQVLNRRGGGAFGSDDEKLLATLSQVLCVNIEHARLYTKTRRQLDQLQGMRQQLEKKVSELELTYIATREVAAALGPSNLARRIGVLILSKLQYDGVLILFSNSGGSCATAMYLTRDNDPVTQEVPWHGPLMNDPALLRDHLTQVGKELGERNTGPVAALSFPVNAYIQGALALFGDGKEADLPADHRKALSVVLSTLVGGFRRCFELQSEQHEDRLLTIGRTVSSLVHDLRTPMAVIGGFAQILESEQDVEEKSRYAEGIRDQLERIERMTEDVLSFARGDIRILPEKVYIRQFAATLEQTCRTVFAASPVEFKFEIHERGAARFDEHKMLRVMANLCRNAVEAMPDGGNCTVSIKREGDYLHVAVKDDGVGIPEHLKLKVFQAFESHGKEEGTGLGLSMAMRIVEAHGGRITLHSTPGQGTEVHLYIPFETNGTSKK